MATETSIEAARPRVIVLTGLSGAGKTVALRAFEDLGFYCVDNLPTALLQSLVAALTVDDRLAMPRIAVGVDVRSRGDLERLPEALSALSAAGAETELLFLDSNEDILLKRFSETRRRHPLSGQRSLPEAIAEERRRVHPLAAIADRVLDTSEMNVHQLRRAIATGFSAADGETTLLFESFAFRRGLPPDSDFVFDARCLPNPNWDPRLRPLSGKDAAVREFLAAQPHVNNFLRDIVGFLEEWVPRFESEDKRYLTVAIGCTGGRHRSVYLAERLAEHFRGHREQVLTFHRELD
ncbi:MAG TPA: RNase adapter RapZ [Rhodanobacteraceae bacterium]|nr:RNase adapter RapZ [Rhodanobacteraceae bacterium]